MVAVKPEAALSDTQHPMPVLWATGTTAVPEPGLYELDSLAPFLPKGLGIALRAFGHRENSVHWLLTRAGTPLHTDPRYARYSYQLVLRNDGGRVRGLPRNDTQLHPPMVPGVMYCLDTHSPHQGVPDERLDPPKVIHKLVAAVDSDTLVKPERVWPLLRKLVNVPLPPGLPDGYKAAPRQVWNP